MKSWKWTLAALLVGCFAWSAAAGPQRIAVLDLEKVFREFYKSKIAEGAIKQQAELYRSYMLKLQDQLRTLEDEYKVARDGAQNLALDEASRDQAIGNMRKKEQEILAKRAEAEQYATDRNRKMREFEQTKRREIIAEIRDEVRRRAVAEGYDFVFDTSGKTMNDVPPLLYYSSAADLTPEVLKTLNATASTSPVREPAPAVNSGAEKK